MRILWGFLIVAGCVFPAFGDGYVKYIRKILPVESGTDFFMDSKFGEIILRQWEKDSLLIEASFRVLHTEDWEKEELSRQLDMKFETWPGTVKVKTEISDEFDREGDLKVETTVYMPEQMVLDLVNRHGNIHIPVYRVQKYLGLTAIYGNIDVDTLISADTAKVYLNVTYGKLQIKECVKAVIRASSSALGVKKGRFLQIKAEKSRIFLESVDSVLSEGKYNLYELK